MQSIDIINKSGNKLAAYLCIPSSKLHTFLIVCHGFRGAKENGGKIFDFASRVNELGIGVLAFDFSGSGQSAGDFASMTLTRQAYDLQCVIDYLDSHYHLPLVLLGRSFGGSTIIAGGAGDERVKAYVLWSTPVFLAETFTLIIPDEYKNLQRGKVMHIHDEFGDYDLNSGFIADFARHDMDEYLEAMSAKSVLIIHAEDDELVPAVNAVYIKNKINKAELFLIKNAGHRFLSKTAERENLTLTWLKQITNQPE